MNKSDLEDKFVADQEPIFFGLSPVTEVVSGDQKQAAVEGVDEEIGGADALAVFDAFLRDTITGEERQPAHQPANLGRLGRAMRCRP